MKLDAHTSASRLWVLLVLFLLAVTGVLWGIGNGVNLLVTKKPGLYEISPNPDDAVPYYRNGFTHMQYLDGQSDKIKLLFNGVTNVYEQALKRSYQLLDETTEYPGYVNLATINNHLGETLTVPQDLFVILQDLWQKTLEQKSINFFSGAVLGEWDAVLALTDMSDYNLDENLEWNQRITRLAEKTADLSNFSAVFDPEHLTVCLTVSPEYLDYLKSIECEYPIVTAGRLKDAWRVQLISSMLESEGYTNGFITTDSGIVQVLSGYRKTDPVPSGCTITTAGKPDTFDMHHQLGNDRYHPVFRLTDGSMPQLIDSCTVRSGTEGITEAWYTALNVFQYATWNEIEEFLESTPSDCTVVRRMP